MHSLLDISHSLVQSQIQSLSIQLSNQLAQNKSTLRVNLRLSRDGQLFLELRRTPTHDTQDIAQGSLFDGHPSDQWRLYHNGLDGCGYFFGDDREIVLGELQPIIGKEMTQLFLALQAQGFVEVRFDSDGLIVEELPTLDWSN